MSFERFGSSDVYIFEDAAGGITCCACLLKHDLVGSMDIFPNFKTPRKALKHLKKHRRAGHDTGAASSRIKAEYEDLDAEIPKYTPSPESEKLMADLFTTYPTDMVNHPPHYTSDPSGVEAITVLRHRNYNIGNAMKYLWRAGIKGQETHIQDLEKAIFYINDEIGRLNGDYK